MLDINFYQSILVHKYNKLINKKESKLHNILLIKNEILNFNLDINFNTDNYFEILKITKKIFPSLSNEEIKNKVNSYIKKNFNFINILQFESRECKIRNIASTQYDSTISDFDNWIIAEKIYDFPIDYSPINLLNFCKKYFKYHFYNNKVYNSVIIGNYIYLFDTKNNNIFKIKNDTINSNTDFPIINDYLIGLNINQIKKILLNLKYKQYLLDSLNNNNIVKILFTKYLCLKNKYNNTSKLRKNRDELFKSRIKNIQLITKNNKLLKQNNKKNNIFNLSVIIPITINRSILQNQFIHRNNIKVFIIVNSDKEYLGILNKFNNNNNNYSIEFEANDLNLIKSNYPSGSTICFN